MVRKEFQVMQSLRHPSIVGVYDLFLAPNLSKSYLCMELVRGKSLQDLAAKFIALRPSRRAH